MQLEGLDAVISGADFEEVKTVLGIGPRRHDDAADACVGPTAIARVGCEEDTLSDSAVAASPGF